MPPLLSGTRPTLAARPRPNHATPNPLGPLARRYLGALLFALLLTCSFAFPAHATIGNRLLLLGRIDWFSVTPDGQAVIVRASGVLGDETTSLYRVPVDGSASPQRLSGDLSVATVWGPSPDGRVILFESRGIDKNLPGAIYSVPVTGGSPTLLSGSLLDNAILTDLSISPDSRSVVFKVVADGPAIVIYAVPIDGGDAVQLISSPHEFPFQFDAGGSRLAYVETSGDTLAETRYSLKTVPLAGGAALTLHKTAAAFSTILQFSFVPDGSSLLYTTDETLDNLFELYRVPITGGDPVNLSRPAFLWPLYAGAYVMAPDSSRVIFRATRTLDHPYELYSVPMTGGALVPLAPASISQTLHPFEEWLHGVSSDSRWLIYAADEGDYSGTRLYRVDIADGDSLQLNKLTTGEILSVYDGQFHISPEGRHVIFRALENNTGQSRLYSAGTAGGPPVRLSGPEVTQFIWPSQSPFSADSRWVFLEAIMAEDGYCCTALVRAPVTGGDIQRMNDLPRDGLQFAPLPAGGQIVFHNDYALYATYELAEAAYLPVVNGTPVARPIRENIIALLEAEGNFTTLLTALEAAGLTDMLRGSEQHTLFAPTDDAFAALPPGVLDQLLSDPTGQLLQILLHHTVPEAWTHNTFMDGMGLPTQQGDVLFFRVIRGEMRVGGARFVTTDRQATNGIVHTIDSVLLPPY